MRIGYGIAQLIAIYLIAAICGCDSAPLPVADLKPAEPRTDVASTNFNEGKPESKKPSEVEALQQQLEEELLTVEVPLTEPIDLPYEVELLATVNDKVLGYPDPHDFLTWEIAASIEQKATLVVWLVDESLSMRPKRDEFIGNFRRVYNQLELIDLQDTHVLETALVGFTEKTRIYTPEPIAEREQLLKAVEQVKTRDHGKENVFSAVEKVARKWLDYPKLKKYNMIINVVTDELGDDFRDVEEVAAFCARYGIRVHCIGREVPFAREKSVVILPEYTWPDGHKAQNVSARILTGCESVQRQYLPLGYWGISAKDQPNIMSGFGPYSLARLCQQTGGRYLFFNTSEQANNDWNFRREYRPDYRPLHEYLKDKASSKAMTASVELSSISPREVRFPTLRFRADSLNQFRIEITESQRPAAELDYKLAQMLKLLESGEAEREEISEPRWQAAFDLAMGRVAALRAQAYAYNVALAVMKSSPEEFQEEKSNTWELVPAGEPDGGPPIEKLAAKATEYLTRVVEEHPNTPWAQAAEFQLGIPMGWKWSEKNLDYSESSRPLLWKPKIILRPDETIDPKTGKKVRRVIRPNPEG